VSSFAALSSQALRRVTADYAARSHLWTPLLRYGTSEHWSMRVHADDDVDIWLITWLQQQSTTLHDHGDSAGGFTVVSGRIREYLASGTEYVVRAGQTRSFGPRQVHDVYNPYAEPAVSVHAYSPPLTQMSYYSLAPGGGLQWVRTEPTVVPEAQATIMPSLTLAG
jgi:mannose-6-phosphate isomerase-like protein (cupin superfamily)